MITAFLHTALAAVGRMPRGEELASWRSTWASHLFSVARFAFALSSACAFAFAFAAHAFAIEAFAHPHGHVRVHPIPVHWNAVEVMLRTPAVLDEGFLSEAITTKIIVWASFAETQVAHLR